MRNQYEAVVKYIADNYHVFLATTDIAITFQQFRVKYKDTIYKGTVTYENVVTECECINVKDAVCKKATV